MKKIFMSIVAVATVAFTLTSCNKEEATSSKNLNIPFEENEIMNQVKQHIVGYDVLFDNGDQFIIMDGGNNTAVYRMNVSNTGSLSHEFVRRMRGTFDENNGTLAGFYPTSIWYSYIQNEVLLPNVQTSAAGEIREFPMYVRGPISDINTRFRNLCGVERFYLKGGVAIDSMSITTDKYINGHFNVNISNLDHPLTYGRGANINPAHAHGTKTNTLIFDAPLQLNNTTATEVSIYLPADTYNEFNVTIYATIDGVSKKCVARNGNAPVIISRTEFNTMSLPLSDSYFTTYENGLKEGRFNIGNGQYVKFAQGNIERVANGPYWRLNDNEWDFVGLNQSAAANSCDIDLFAWGATERNGIRPYMTNRTALYPYFNGTELSGTSEWGNQKFFNGGNQYNSGWRTLTADEMSAILLNNDNAIVTLGFVGVTGLIICPEGFTGVCPAANSTLTKAEWNQLEKAGCVFFAINSYRKATGNPDRLIPAIGTSYFWLNANDDNTTAYALKVTANGTEIVNNLNRKTGAFVRLAKVVTE